MSNRLKPTTKRCTIRDVAQAANVSVAVVSIVLNGREGTTVRVHPDTRQRVRDTATRMGYRPALQASGLRQRRSFLVGVLLSETNAWLAADVIRGVQEIASPRRYSPIVFVHGDSDQEREEFERSLDRRVDALLVDTFDLPAQAENIRRYQQLARSGFPLLELFGISIPGVPKVNFDFRGDGRRAVERILALGHRRIALVFPDQYKQRERHWTAAQFFNGCGDALAAAGLPCNPILVPGIAVEDVETYLASGQTAARQILAAAPRPTAVVCFSVLRAYGLLQELTRVVRVPEEMSVFAAGYDSKHALLATPPLTGMRLDPREAGRAAAALAFDLLEGRAAEEKLIPCLFDERKSVGRCPSAAGR